MCLEAVEAEENAKKVVVNADKKIKDGARDESQTTVPAHVKEGKSLVLLQGASGETGMAAIQAHMTEAWKMAESDEPTANPEEGNRR